MLLLKVTFIAEALLSLNIIVETLEAEQQGAVFLFGYLGGAEAPYVAKDGAEAYLLAFRVLPQILMFAVIVAILWYYKVLQWLVRGLGLVMQRSMGIPWRARPRRCRQLIFGHGRGTDGRPCLLKKRDVGERVFLC